MALIHFSPLPDMKAPRVSSFHESVLGDTDSVQALLIRLSDFSLRNPLIPSLVFGVFLHVTHLLVYRYGYGSLEGFWPQSLLSWVIWLPEFILPWMALHFFAAAHRMSNQSWNSKVAQGLERNREVQKVSILGFAKIAEVRDADTGDHILRLSHFSRMLAEEIGKLPAYRNYVNRKYCEEIFLSAPLHDIGKVGIADNILKKPGPLSASEFQIMKMHTILGGDLLNDLELKLGFRTFYSLGRQIAYHHHQSFDGKGYPNVLGPTRAMFIDDNIGKPLKGEDIPLSARIVALADVYDALVSKRCYKEPIPHEKVLDMIVEDSGKRFDPDLVEAFLRLENKFLRINSVLKK